MSDLKEYVVTLKNFEDLDDFYYDMETPGGDLYIPNREVDLALRRPISRSTHYYLTKEEAEMLKNDPRVLEVSLTPPQLGLEPKPMWIQSSNFWDKSNTNNNSYLNWGLLRCTEGIQRPGWGSSISDTKSQTGTVTVNAEGRNVDVVIVDGFIDPNHPEMAVNSNGTGGTRVVQYNWLQHAVPVGTYSYSVGSNANNNHGLNVAGIAVGNTQGWARRANIYNFYPYTGDSLLIFDYIRAWHNSKPINPNTGRRNPTVVNNSWGYAGNALTSSITRVNYRGTNYTTGLDYTLFQSLGLNISSSTFSFYATFPALDQDQLDAINDGIIVIGAAGNGSYKIDTSNGLDYNNYFVYDNTDIYFYHRGMSPTSGVSAICVGAIGTSSLDEKASYSNCGPRVDIYAPGSSIISSVYSGGVADSRNSSYFQQKYSGTSQASPQVCGVVACLMEIYPQFNQAQVTDYLIKNSKYNQITDSGGSYTDYTSLQGSENRYLYYKKERSDTGSTWPKLNYLPRPSSGRMFPRVKVKR